MAITTLQQLGILFSAIQQSSECVIYATLDFQETAFAPIIESHSQAPVNSTTCRDLGTALDRVYRPQAGWGGGRSWVSVT